MIDLKGLMKHGIYSYNFSLIINIDRCILSSQILFLLLLSHRRCLSQHKLRFWTGIRQKIRCEIILVGMDS